MESKTPQNEAKKEGYENNKKRDGTNGKQLAIWFILIQLSVITLNVNHLIYQPVKD